jgi:SulP family sulfate permease
VTSSTPVLPHKTKRSTLGDFVPVFAWAKQYKRQDLVGDLMAGLIVTIMLVPQSMAYALLAGLPPQVGLYASILPLVLYGLLGTSKTLAVGPVAIVSLLVASGVGPLAESGTAQYGELVLTLAFLVAVIQGVMGLVRLGFLVNFLSHPVLAGFTSAAALVIGLSQLKHLLGLSLPNLEFFPLIWAILTHLGQTNLITLAIGLGGILILLYFRHGLGDQLKRWGVRPGVAMAMSKSAPLIIVLLGTLLVWLWQLDETAGVKVVGFVPAGLPPLTTPQFDLTLWRALLPTALVISFVGYMESIAVAKSLASKRRQKVVANQELIALGVANLGATFTGGYPVTGGFSRSVVNFDAGANTGLASMITAGLMALTVIFLTPLFYFLPQAILAAIVIVAVTGLIDVQAFRHIWRYNQADALSYGATFVAVLLFDVEIGILIGVVTAILLFVYRTSTPHVAVVGRVGESEIYRNVLRHQVQCWPELIALRIDESLYFANTKFLEETVLGLVADRPEIKHFVLIGTAINFIDASALETLASLHRQLKDAGVIFHLAAIKGPVMDRLQAIGFVDHIGRDHVHNSTHEALKALGLIG